MNSVIIMMTITITIIFIIITNNHLVIVIKMNVLQISMNRVFHALVLLHILTMDESHGTVEKNPFNHNTCNIEK